jgi:hypothetical protein
MPGVRTLVTIAATAASAVLLAVLLVDHTAGGELEGVIVAAIATATGLLALWSVRRGGARRRLVIVLWLVVAAGGGIGYADHQAQPHPGRPVLDDRPRPPLAPLVFTVIGLAGAVAAPARRRDPLAGAATARLGDPA